MVNITAPLRSIYDERDGQWGLSGESCPEDMGSRAGSRLMTAYLAFVWR